jgi:hypothetical protein
MNIHTVADIQEYLSCKVSKRNPSIFLLFEQQLELINIICKRTSLLSRILK